jgi:hypothetical protein
MENKTEAPVEKRKHVFLFSGQVYFHPDAEGSEIDVQSVHMNCVGIFTEEKVTAPELGKIQAQMSQQLRARVPNPITVVDVVFHSVNHMGYMTPEEWAGTTEAQIAAGMKEAQAVIDQVQASINSKTVQ